MGWCSGEGSQVPPCITAAALAAAAEGAGCCAVRMQAWIGHVAAGLQHGEAKQRRCHILLRGMLCRVVNAPLLHASMLFSAGPFGRPLALALTCMVEVVTWPWVGAAACMVVVGCGEGGRERVGEALEEVTWGVASCRQGTVAGRLSQGLACS